MTTAPTTVLLVGLSLGDPGRLAFLGLFGLLVLLLVVARFEHGLATFGGGESSSVSKTNCPACGARIEVDADQCPHCERSLGDDDEAPDYGWVET